MQSLLANDHLRRLGVALLIALGTVLLGAYQHGDLQAENTIVNAVLALIATYLSGWLKQQAQP